MNYNPDVCLGVVLWSHYFDSSGSNNLHIQNMYSYSDTHAQLKHIANLSGNVWINIFSKFTQLIMLIRMILANMQTIDSHSHSHFSHTSVQSDLTHSDRLKFKTIAIADMHARDIVDLFVEQHINDARQFQWMSRLRFHWHKDVDNIFIEHYSGMVEYYFMDRN